MEIRFATEKDVAGILELLRQIGAVHHRGRPDLFREDAQKYSASQVLALLNDPSRPVFVAVEDCAVVGYGFCIIRKFEKSAVVNDHTELYIDDLCVDEACRGKGIGTALYGEILRYAKARGCYNVTLNVWAFNAEAIAFYESLGLKPRKLDMETIL